MTIEAIKYTSDAEWHSIRRQGIGGSDAGAIMGFSPWRTPVDVWMEKTGRVVQVPKKNRALEIGKRLEQMVADFYVEDSGRRVQKFNFTLKDGIFLGNVDRLVIPDGEKVAAYQRTVKTNRILECKTSGDFDWDEVPLSYQAQVQLYMSLCPSVESVDVAVYFKSCNEFKIYTVERDQPSINRMREYLNDWWNRHVIEDEKPEPTSEADCRKLWSNSREEIVIASEEIEDVVRRLQEIKSQMESLKKLEESYRFQIISYMGERDTLVTPFTNERILTYKSTKDREKLEVEDLLQELKSLTSMSDDGFEALRQSYTKTTPGARMMRFINKQSKN